MKQKIVISMVIPCDKCRSKIMKIAVSVSGVESATVQLEKNQLEVVGNRVDTVELTKLLRKKVGPANIVSVAAVEAKEKKPEEKKPEITLNPAIAWPSYSNIGYVMPCHDHYNDQPSCTIM